MKTEVEAQRPPISSSTLAIGQLRKPTAAKLLRRRHPEHARPRQTVDHVFAEYPLCDRSRSRRVPRPKTGALRSSDCSQFLLLRGRGTRIRHRPIRHELPEEKPLREAQRLRPGEEQLFCFLDLFLPLNLCFVHKVTIVVRGGWNADRAREPAVPPQRNPRQISRGFSARLTTGNFFRWGASRLPQRRAKQVGAARRPELPCPLH